jgi:alpha/beta superfamily hydrolase
LSKGLAVIAHPHPLFGGTMDNKVVQTLAKACVAADWECLRFNFRGVGDSEGVFDAGRGETEDLLQLVDQWPADMPLVLAGFSFGAFVVCQAVQALWASARIQKILLMHSNVHWSCMARPMTRWRCPQ